MKANPIGIMIVRGPAIGREAEVEAEKEAVVVLLGV